MIIGGSRYQNSPVVTVVKGSQDVSVIVPSEQVPFSFNYISHMVAQGDRIDNISFQYYGDPTLWWRVADANPEVMYYDSLVTGSILRIPVVA